MARCLALPLLTSLALLGLGCAFDKSMFRTYFGCPPCDESQCVNPVGCNLVKETGICGCCYTCSRSYGEACGIYTEQCEQGLKCTPPDNSADAFEALVEGRGQCLKDPRIEEQAGFRRKRSRDALSGNARWLQKIRG